ncbi:MAG: tetratricopeptide repeat protein [Candidatus Melainabacteria bacterium]|nr:tetratricopeptide repeat protein [Candidatus Melainabacteria bacterium]
MAIETYTFNDVKGSPTPDSNTFDFSKIMAGAPNLLDKIDKPENNLRSSGALDFSGKSLFLCAETKDDKPKDPNEDKFAKAGYKAYLSGDYKEAEKQYKSFLEISEKQYGKESKEVAFANELLGSTCEKDKRYAEAKAYYKQSAEITGKASGKEHYDTGLQLNNVARMDHQLKNWKEAAAGYKSAVAILAAEKNGPSSDNGRMTDATTALKSYAEVLKELGEKDEAAKQLKRAAEIEKNYRDNPKGNVIYF